MSPTTILNVDDNEAGRYAVTRILERYEYRVREACNGTEALRLARTEQPDLILLDVNLPDINGMEVCRRLRSDSATATIPILHITASYVTPSDMARGLESGADNYLMEPVEPDVLVAAIRSTLRAKEAEEAARATARDWQSTFDAISDGVALVGADGRIERANEALARLLGRPLKELIGQSGTNLWTFLPNEKQPFAMASLSRQRETLEFEAAGKRLLVSVDPRMDAAGNVVGAVKIVRDVTDVRRLAEQFQESQKFETIGTLAAGVAHDFNNLLTSIMGNASLVLADLSGDAGHRERLEDVLRAGERAADLTRQLLAYSGKGRHYMQRLELSGVVARTRPLIEAAVPKKITVELQLAEDLPRIDADANQLQQVVLNLVSNAAEAIGENTGTIAIATGLEESAVYIEVRDTGCGMDAETKARIFDPFFTTKFTGRGLGLAAVAGIARGHKGAIRVQSEPGQGSTFRLYIPAAEEPVATSPASLPAAGGDTVLVVDDEEMVRRIAQTALSLHGYRVILANNGLEAIRQARSHPEIGLVLLDLTMPVMGGEEAISAIRQTLPGAKVIVSTGYDHREAANRFREAQVAGYLQKPYTSRQLLNKVSSIIGARAAQH
jgi:PAS domain S-box-containing protein